jgi:hypothetical protein
MPFVFKRLALFMSIAAAFAADKTAQPFKPGPAGSFTSHQSSDQITVGVQPYTASERVKSAFGKLDPNEHGVLPVLVVIQNDRGQAVSLEKIKVEYIAPNNDRVMATPASEVRYLQPVRRPVMGAGPIPKIMNAKNKNPLADPVIEVRAFSALMLPAGNTASGFFYFDTSFEPGAKIYITGLKEAGTGKDILFFELPL